jgi:predicted enzyme related to lactoylglutathione lyase
MTQNNDRETRAQGSNVDTILMRNGGLSYLEIPATDARQSAAFYASVLGWNVDGAQTDVPKFSDQTGHLIGRWIAGRAISREPGFLPYFYVDRIRDVVSRVVPGGGEIIKSPYAEGGLLIATIRDPAGNVIGLWEEE